ncbi:MAG: exodeoxyribonuclease VII small subunit [Pseudomonadota bacterium]
MSDGQTGADEGGEGAPPETLDFEAAMRELEDIVQMLERGETSLERSLDLYERGTALKRVCDTKLEAARTRIEAITLDSDGAPSGTKPLDGD